LDKSVHPLVIIGAGPAGYTAAIYAARAGLSPFLIRGPEPGGQLMITTDVENFPGFTSILGPDLMVQMEKQAEAVGTLFQEDTIQSLHQKGALFEIEGRSQKYSAQAVIVATGASARWLGLPSETHFRGYGVSACATCDGPFFKNKVVAVVGGGNSAVEEALFLSRHASKVFLIHRRDTLRAERVLQERLFQNPKIEPLWNRTVQEIHGEEKPFRHVTAVTLQGTQASDQERLALDGVFVAIGHIPNTGFLKGLLPLDDEGYIVMPHPERSETKIPGLFAAGDVRDKIYRQAVTAAGQGCMAALDAEKYLAEREAAG
jgi:thioredoxin reductase (NADPH)